MQMPFPLFRCPVRFVLSAMIVVAVNPDTIAQRQMESLGRGVVAIRRADNKVFVGWRLLGTDPDDTAFNVYRSSNSQSLVKLNAKPITTATHFVDGSAPLDKTNS
jgi:rhamnogalacturonan endolyase